MAVVGFKQYREGDRYKARRAAGKASNLIWKVIGIIVVVGSIFLVIKYTATWRHELNAGINENYVK